MLPTFDTPGQGAVYMLEQRGLHVFPLKPNGKEPLSGYAWRERAPGCDKEEISLYHGQNFGVCMTDSVFALDVDNKNGATGGVELASLQLDHGDLPRTFTIRTPSGGLHLYFRGQSCNSASKIAPGLDTRAAGGYVVAPGSTIEGTDYAVTDDSAFAEAPQWLVELANAPAKKDLVQRAQIEHVDDPREVAKAVEYLSSVEPAYQGHGGDSHTYKVAVKLHDFGLSEEKSVELMLEHFDPRCAPPWGEEGIALKVGNAFNYAQNSHGARTDEAAFAEATDVFGSLPLPPPPPPADMSELDSKLNRCEFNLDNPPARTSPVLTVGDVGVAKPGDLVVVQAKVKAGKSAVLGAMMASIMGKHDQGHDYLGWKGENPEKLPVLHLDTEQSPEDHYDLIKRTLDRAGISKTPAWFHSYCITDFSMKERRKAMVYKAEQLFEKHGGLCAIFLDGIGDMCEDLNDGVESNKLVEVVYSMAIKYRCPLINVLHENHGSETGKTRGHLGSQLERKAASNLRLEKDGKSGVIQLWGERLRRGHIGKGEGPSFVWSKQRQMHVTTIAPQQAEALEAAETFGTQREEVEEFLALHVEGKTLAVDLNRKAVDEGRWFGDKTRTARFTEHLKKLLEGSTRYKVRQQTDRRAWYVEATEDLYSLI